MKTKTAPTVNGTADSPAISVQQKFADARKAMKAALIERDEEIDLALTALIAQEHILLVGVPGTAKSLIVETLRQWMDGASSLTIHCCKDTTRNVAFGPIKLSAMKEDRIERELSGGAADVEVLILEEVFKAGPAVLDMFLMLMNERVYREGLVAADAPLKLILGVSNEWSPEGCEAALAAFFDRFLFRKAVSPISPKGRRELLKRSTLNDPCKAEFPHKLSALELERATKAAKELPWSVDAKKAMWAAVEELSKEGINPGDRRLYKAVTAVRAYAWLCGAKRVENNHLTILSHVLWDDPTEQPAKCAKIVLKHSRGKAAVVEELLKQAEDAADGKPAEATAKVQDITGKIAEMGGIAHETATVTARVTNGAVILAEEIAKKDDPVVLNALNRCAELLRKIMAKATGSRPTAKIIRAKVEFAADPLPGPEDEDDDDR